MLQNYRNAFIRLAVHYLNVNQNDKALKIMDAMQVKMPRNVIGMELPLLYEVGNIYYSAGGIQQYKEIAADVEKKALKQIEENPGDVQSYYNPYRILLDTYGNLKAYGKLYDLWLKIQTMYPNDPQVKANVEKYKRIVQQQDTLNNKK